MEITVPQSFVEVEAREFEYLFGNLDYTRDAYCGGECYRATGYQENGRPKNIGVHLTKGDRYLIDPEFFLPGDRLLQQPDVRGVL